MKSPPVPNWVRLLPLIILLFSYRAFGFSLLGPYADWMQVSNGYRLPGDIGAPVDITEGYRWNVPVLTYGFDPSFLQHFGSNGVAAVERAIQTINDLPPASSLILADYPLEARGINYFAMSQQLFDLKSTTLAVLLEQMGLAQPIRSIFTLRRWDLFFISYPDSPSWPAGTIPNYVLERNFDPETLIPSHVVNIGEQVGVVAGDSHMADVYEFQIEPTVSASAVAERHIYVGYFWQGLTRDDVGGLRYLLSKDNIRYEILLPDVHTVATSDAHGHGKAHGKKNKAHKHTPFGSVVSGALRPGVEKVTFVRQDYDSRRGAWFPITYQFTDTYITNGVAMEQELERTVLRPDFLFTAADNPSWDPYQPPYARTGTTDWWKSSASALGPGIIIPQVQITFSTSGTWGSFDDSTNPPTTYPPLLKP